jgi:hypothetical protein
MRLNKYADQAEYMETALTDMITNHMFLDKDKCTKTASISYGRNYIIESPNAVLNRYETAKEQGDNTIVLDRLYQEYLLTKYKSDELGLRIAITKSKVEPYIHYSAEQVQTLMNDKESARKVLFTDWWKTIKDFDKTPEVLRGEYEYWFNDKYIPQKEEGEA